MKKLLTIAVAAGLMFAAAGKVQAAPIETKGNFHTRYWYLSDYFQTLNAAAEEKVDFTHQRLRLWATWPVAEGVKIQTRFDVLEQFWGANTEFQDLTFFTSNTQIDFDQVNAQFAWPGTPLTFTVGKQDVSWGPGVLAKSDNRFRAKVAGKFDPIGVSFSWDKNIETLHGATLVQGLENQDDSDGYTLALTTDVAGFKLGLLGAYGLDQTVANSTKHRYGVDAFATGKLGMASVNAEVAYYTGTDETTGASEKDVNGLLGYVGCTVPAGPVTIGAEFAYASGDDPDTASENEGVLKFDYQAPFWSVILFNNMDLPGWESSPGGTDTSVSNAWAAKVSGTAQVMPALSLTGAVVYAARLEDTATAKADPLGTELDLIASYAITENVGLMVGGAYLIAGDFYGDSIDDPWGATLHVNVNF